MENRIQLKYILVYLVFVLFQLSILRPQMVVGINVPVVLAIVFDLFNHDYIISLHQKINVDTTFIALLFSIAAIILVLVDFPFAGTSLLLITIALFWRSNATS